MKEEFDLSKKLRGSKNYTYFDFKDVEEFIRLLKMKFKIGVEYLEKDIINSIDDLAGELRVEE